MAPAHFIDLEHYAIVGNLETCALISRHGSIDWFCFPYLESPAVFAGLLDPGRGGFFSISPRLKFDSLQMYEHDTKVLRTMFSTPTGQAAVTDFMPLRHDRRNHRMLLRRIEGVGQECTLSVRFEPRFDFGRHRGNGTLDDNTLTVEARHLGRIILDAPVPLQWQGDSASVELSVKEGETYWFVLHWGDEATALSPESCAALLDTTRHEWRQWCRSASCSESIVNELSREMALRSGMTLKLLAAPDSGAIAAAATTSLPESVGGLRNWDYRYAWLRDASFTAQALHHMGHDEEATRYREWVLHLVGKMRDLSRIKPLYGIHQDPGHRETFIDSLCGYRYSAPVRVGNLAAGQTQIDIYGEIVNAVYDITRYGHDITHDVWQVVKRIVDFVCRVWKVRDRGIWEMRTAPRHYVHSKLMCWVALDRGIRIAEEHGFAADVDKWRAVQNRVREAILEKGFSRRLNSFVQSFDSEDIDATAVLIPAHGFLPADDPRVQGTLDAVMKHLCAGDGLVYRYLNDDGLAGREGAFLLCSFWLINALALSRRVEEAEDLFHKVLQHVGPAGLLSEMIDPVAGKMIGNFPQAISHIGMINSALHLGVAKGGGHRGPPPLGEERAISASSAPPE